MCRSLTYAQRALRLLARENIRARISKAPQGVTPEGCSYGVRLSMEKLQKARALLGTNGIRTGRIYRLDGKGGAWEMSS